MGLFLSMSGVIGGDEPVVEAALREFALGGQGDLRKEQLATEDDGCLVISEGSGGATVLYPHGFLGWDEASEFLSRELGLPVFSFHIHDGDLWMYLLFHNGKVVDQFNPLPDYWQELDEGERRQWRGSAQEIAERVPGLAAASIAQYLVQWGPDVLERIGRRKAYPDDRFYYGDDWQLVDFMKRLGLSFPIDDRGTPFGATYRFTYEGEGAS